MSEHGICPLLGVNANCKESCCAWWDNESECCALVSIAQCLNELDRSGIITHPIA